MGWRRWRWRGRGREVVLFSGARGVVHTVVVTPATSSPVVGATDACTAKAYDSYGTEVTGVSFTWDVPLGAGTVNSSGVFTAATAVELAAVRATETVTGISGTVGLTSVPDVVATVTVSPSAPSVVEGATQTFTAVATDSHGNVRSGDTITWSVTGGTAGTIGSTSGIFTASATAGSYPNVIVATDGAITGTASVTVTAASAVSKFLLEDGTSHLLLEDGVSALLLEV